MTDDELIYMVAKVWVDNGGDAVGLDWCKDKIKEAIEEIIKDHESLLDDSTS